MQQLKRWLFLFPCIVIVLALVTQGPQKTALVVFLMVGLTVGRYIRGMLQKQ